MSFSHLLEDVVLLVGGERYPLSSVFKLRYSYVLVGDFSDRQFTDPVSIKILLKFKNKNQSYWCNFECGNKSISLIGSNELTFSGFTWSETDGRVNEFTLDDSHCCQCRICCCSQSSNVVALGNDLVFSLSIHNAMDKRQRSLYDVCDGMSFGGVATDTVDGSRRTLVGFESHEKSNEVYRQNTRYREGSMLLSIYIIFYKRNTDNGAADAPSFISI